MPFTSCVDVHLFPNDKEGHALLHQLQQRAEAWAEAVSPRRDRTDDSIPLIAR